MDAFRGEVAPGTKGLFAFHLAVEKQPRIAAQQIVLEMAEQFDECCRLALRRPLLLEIPNQTDTDGVLVVGTAGNVTSPELFRPARTRFNLAVAGIRSVADHKMIRQPVLHVPLAAMVGIELRRVARRRGAVMNNEVFPPIRVHSSDRDRRWIQMLQGRTEPQALAGSYAIGRETVPTPQ